MSTPEPSTSFFTVTEQPSIGMPAISIRPEPELNIRAPQDSMWVYMELRAIRADIKTILGILTRPPWYVRLYRALLKWSTTR